MARPKPPLNIAKYKRTPQDVPIDKWLQLFYMKASEASWTHRHRVSHFSEYIEGEAFKWHLTDFQRHRDMGRYKARHAKPLCYD
ncbi:hypothetical protein HPB50_004760 [Hyalomma asiaticum]|uniref:Uncharacterized protein n=1 Tax=Hyalomma asiaticum TaxID=266040 RepID=A0ACB7S5A9_HYAAI|nr:hypothetical protein HPB50_004760 [Hyalomma asiaticum]